MTAKSLQLIPVVRPPADAYPNSRVHRLVYDHDTGDWSEEDWLEMALASIDQAGFPVRDQQAIERILRASFERRQAASKVAS